MKYPQLVYCKRPMIFYRLLLITAIIFCMNFNIALSQSSLPSPQDTTIYFVPYYKFIQYFPKSRVNYYFGEVGLMRTNGERTGIMLLNWDQQANNPLVLHPNDFASVSGTDPFVASAGDTIAYYRYFQIECESDTATIWVNIQDTVAFLLELINDDDGSLIVPLDTAGVYPHNSRYDFDLTYFGTKDISIKRRRIIPQLSSDGGEINARLQIRPVFFGDSSRLAIGRWDYPDRLLSRVEREERRILDSAFTIFVDSILAEMDKKGISRNISDKVSFDIVPTVASAGDFNISAEVSEAGEYIIEVFDVLGKKRFAKSIQIEKGKYSGTITIDKVPPGSYFVVLRTSDHVIATKTVKIIF